jgi:hypothetical protein
MYYEILRNTPQSSGTPKLEQDPILNLKGCGGYSGEEIVLERFEAAKSGEDSELDSTLDQSWLTMPPGCWVAGVIHHIMAT